MYRPRGFTPKAPAGAGDIVPVSSPSSSDVGLPLEFPESSRGELAISVMAKGLAKVLSATKRKSSGGDGSSGRRSSPETDAGARASPGPFTLGPSRVEAAAGDAVFKRPGSLSFKMRKRPTSPVDLSEMDLSDDIVGER